MKNKYRYFNSNNKKRQINNSITNGTKLAKPQLYVNMVKINKFQQNEFL